MPFLTEELETKISRKVTKKDPNHGQILDVAQSWKKATVWATSAHTPWVCLNWTKSGAFEIWTLDLFSSLRHSLAGASVKMRSESQSLLPPPPHSKGRCIYLYRSSKAKKWGRRNKIREKKKKKVDSGVLDIFYFGLRASTLKWVGNAFFFDRCNIKFRKFLSFLDDELGVVRG